jgi:hypothetical protein
MEGEETDDDPDNPNYKLPSPIRVGSAMANRAYNAKYPVDQHQGSKEQHERCRSHNWMRKCDYSEDDCSDTPYHRNPPMTL